MSPSSIAVWRKDQEDYYKQYLSDNRPPKIAQTQPMAVGSAFDAYVKADLYKKLVNKGDPKYEFNTLFEMQVEPDNRALARIDGKTVFDAYVKHGGQAELVLEMQDALTEPKFEIDVESELSWNGKAVKMLGKPDVFFVNRQGAHVIVDFKVNGFYSRYKMSPKKGYVRLLPGRTEHKDCLIRDHNGVRINMLQALEHLDETWASQLSIYAWLCGCEIGSDWIAGIEQLVCQRNEIDIPDIKVAQHRMICSRDFQLKLIEECCEIWEIVNSDHIFRHMSKEASQERCATLERYAQSISEMSAGERSFL